MSATQQDRTALDRVGGLSYLNPAAPEPWASFVEQIERVRPHLGALERWFETLKHPKRAVFLDDASSGVAAESREEKEANQFAADVLIPPAAKKRLAGIDPSELAIKAFAQGIEIHPGIVVGNQQYLGIVPYASPLTRLKARYELKTN